MAELKLVQRKKVETVEEVKIGHFFVRRGGCYDGEVYVVTKDSKGLYMLVDIATGERWNSGEEYDEFLEMLNYVNFDGRKFQQINNPIITVEGEF